MKANLDAQKYTIRQSFGDNNSVSWLEFIHEIRYIIEQIRNFTYDIQVTGVPTNVKLQMKVSANIDEPIGAKTSSIKAIQSLIITRSTGAHKS